MGEKLLLHAVDSCLLPRLSLIQTPPPSTGATAAGISCFVLEALSDTLSSDHEQDRVLLLFLSDDVLRSNSGNSRQPRPEPVQARFEFRDAGPDAPAAPRKSSAATARRTNGDQVGGA